MREEAINGQYWYSFAIVGINISDYLQRFLFLHPEGILVSFSSSLAPFSMTKINDLYCKHLVFLWPLLY